MPRYFRKVIKIRAEDSPNVKRARELQSRGMQPDGAIIIPGVMPWDDYQKRRATWDPIRQCIGLDAEFYEGAEALLFPPMWLNRAEALAEQHLRNKCKRKAKGIGIDPAQGSSKTTMCAVDDMGILPPSMDGLISKLTPDTNVIPREAKAYARYHGIPPSNASLIVFDRGGGGKQHADRLRAEGWRDVRTVAFGESVVPDPKRGMVSLTDLMDQREEKYTYFNRRAELYGTLRELLDPGENPAGFAISAEYSELRRQLSLIPLLYDQEGRLVLPPKSPRPKLSDTKSTAITLTSIIGHSPDEADALVLAIYAMRVKAKRIIAGPL